MLSEFFVYLRLGFEHISDIRGYDHILFVAALCAVYRLDQWKKLLWLVTAFTVGHSITLALATLDLIRFDDHLIEVLIPVTIVVTSIINIAERPRSGRAFGRANREPKTARYLKYALALGFGLIHGMGFSNFLRAVLGTERHIAWPLFSFNVGLEFGQIAIVVVVLLLSTIVVRLPRMDRPGWVLVLSGATGGIALTMIVDRLVG